MPANILCIEDEQDFRENIVQILESEGYKVTEAQNGEVALQQARKALPDCIICDVNMPKKNGFDFYKEFKKLNFDAENIPCIFLTAMGQKKDIMHGISLNADSYMVKPIDFDILLATIHAKLEQRKRKQLQLSKIEQGKMIHSTVSRALLVNIKDSLSDIQQLIDNNVKDYKKVEDIKIISQNYQKIIENLVKIESICYGIINMINYALDEE